MKMLMLVLFLVLFVGCASGPQTNGNAPSNETVNKSVQEVTPSKKHKADNFVHKPQRKWRFNGEEFMVHGSEIVPGAQVYNVTLAQYGVVQSYLYVTLQPESNLQQLKRLLRNIEVESISQTGNSNYRLTFGPMSDIYGAYKSLVTSESVTSAEISVFYNGTQDDVM